MKWADKDPARLKTVFDVYRRHSGRRAIPDFRQYWTACGKYESLKKGGEIVQAISEGVITQGQYYAAEVNPERCAVSSAVIKKVYPYATIENADLVQMMDSYLRRGMLAPELVYVDIPKEPRATLNRLASVLDVVNQTNGYTMVVGHMIVRNPRGKRVFDWDDLYDYLKSNKALLYHMKVGGWELQHEWRFYKWKRATMATVVFTREAK
jgi:hypothetical protein